MSVDAPPGQRAILGVLVSLDGDAAKRHRSGARGKEGSSSSASEGECPWRDSNPQPFP